MNQDIEVIPGIFEKTFVGVSKKIKLVKPFVQWVQIDIADNKFVPNLSFLDPYPFKKLIKESRLFFELHMMIERPFKEIDRWIIAGFKRVLIHIESIEKNNNESEIKYKLNKLKKNIEIGLAVDKETKIKAVFPYLDIIDCILIMTIKAGFSGQKFIPEMLSKVSAVKHMKPDISIEVDGGITYDTAKIAVASGANRLVSTSTIFNADSIEEAIKALRGKSK